MQGMRDLRFLLTSVAIMSLSPPPPSSSRRVTAPYGRVPLLTTEPEVTDVRRKEPVGSASLLTLDLRPLFVRP